MNKTMAWTIGLLIAFPAHAQTIAEATAHAWSRNPQASAVAAREAEAQARVDVAAGITPGPASVSFSSLNDRLNRGNGKQEWEVEVATPLWLPGQKAARADEAESSVLELAARRIALRLQIAGEVRESWWAVAGARNARELAERRRATARALETDVVRRFKAGDLARMDANLAQNERLAAEAELLEAEALLRQAEQIYRGLTGDAPPLTLAAERAATAHDTADNHPLLAAAAAFVRTTRARLRITEESRRDAPELAVRVLRDRADFHEPYANTIGLKLTIPFSSGARVRQDSASARAEASQADAELTLVQQKLKLDIARARLDGDSAFRQLEMGAVRRDLTADNLRLAEKSFSLGESDLATLLRMRAAALDAEALFARQRIARDAAVSRLNQALGVLP
ncbi:MAG: TolC family protein [Rhodocyclaceae bacterium]|nr:MAG: TolC family protein [Rhodocyclaceae bacterium]